MDCIFWDANDKYVIGWMLYGKKSDTKLYKDAGCTVQATTTETETAFKKRAVVSYDGGLYQPVSCVTASGVAKVTIVTTGSSDAATLVALSSVKDA